MERASPRVRDQRLLVVTGGGGGDGGDVYRLGIDVTAAGPQLRTVLVAGPYADSVFTDGLTAGSGSADRVRVLRNMSDCANLMAQAGAVIQMAGYNSRSRHSRPESGQCSCRVAHPAGSRRSVRSGWRR